MEYIWIWARYLRLSAYPVIIVNSWFMCSNHKRTHLTFQCIWILGKMSEEIWKKILEVWHSRWANFLQYMISFWSIFFSRQYYIAFRKMWLDSFYYCGEFLHVHKSKNMYASFNFMAFKFSFNHNLDAIICQFSRIYWQNTITNCQYPWIFFGNSICENDKYVDLYI